GGQNCNNRRYAPSNSQSRDLACEPCPSGGGATDTITPPASGDRVHRAIRPTPRSQTVAGSTVLVVDDEPRIVEFLVDNLRADDFSVLTAASAEEAIDVLGGTRPDVMLLDVVLPGMSGIDLCRRVRTGDGINDPWDPDLPIIMLSAKAEHTDRVRGLSRGADDCVTTP